MYSVQSLLTVNIRLLFRSLLSKQVSFTKVETIVLNNVIVYAILSYKPENCNFEKLQFFSFFFLCNFAKWYLLFMIQKM